MSVFHCGSRSVIVEYSRRAPGGAALSKAAVAHADTVRWSAWPVMPSGPNVSTVSGRTSSISAARRATASAASTWVHSPSR